MNRTDVAVTLFAVAYNLFGFWVWRRAARYYRRGAPLGARLGLGWGMLRAENYAAEGQRARRQLVAVYVAAVPAFLAWIWLWAFL
jgi:hypothetical protein